MNHLEHRSILFLCEYCFEGFDNAIVLLKHKQQQHVKPSGASTTSEKPLQLPLALPFRRSDGLTTDLIGTQLPVPVNLENIEVSSTWNLQQGVSRTVYQNRGGDDVEYPYTLHKTIISEDINRKTKIRQTPELSTPAVITRQVDRGGQQLRAPNFAQGSLRVETAVCSITDSNSNLDQFTHAKSSSNSYKQSHNPAIYTQKKRNENKSGIGIAQVFPREHPAPPKKKLQCQYCKKSGFSHITQVINHERIHTGERPFTCSHCKVSFTWKNSLASHLAKSKQCRYRQKNESSDTQPTIVSLLQEEQQQQLHSIITSCDENISTVSTDLPYNCHYCGECYVSASESALHFKKSVTCAMLREQSLTSKISSSSPPYRSTNNFEKQSKFNSSSASVVDTFKNSIVDATTTPKADADSNLLLDNFQKHEKPFQCSQCDRTFSLRRFLVNHERSHRRSGIGRPRQESKSNLKLKIGLTHRKNNYHIKPTIATLNLKQMELQSESEEIKTSSTEEAEPESIHVNLEFINGRAYYSCNLCNYKYSTKYHAFNHVRSHTGNTPFKCMTCKAEFTTKQLLSLHKRKNHRRRGRRPLSPSKLKRRSSNLHTCHICNRSYKFKSLLHLHLKTCSGSETTVEKLQNLIDAATTPNAAVISSSTATMKSLQIKTSNKQPNYSPLDHTTRHLVAETGKTIHVGNFCTKSFASSWYATHHVKLHTGEVSHKCDDCGKGFSLETSLNSHRLKYHIPMESPFKCSVCGNGFRTENKLNSHLAKRLCGFEVEKQDTDTSPLTGSENENNGANIEIIGSDERNGTQYSPSDNNEDGLDFGQSPTDDELEFGDGESTESTSDHEMERQNFLSDTGRNSFSNRNERYCQYCGDRVTRNLYDGHVKRCELNTRSPNIV